MKTHDEKTVNVQDAAWFADWKKRLATAIKANDQKAIDAITEEATPPAAINREDQHIHIYVGGVKRRVKDGDELEAAENTDDDDTPPAARLDGLEKRVGDHDTMLNAHNDKHTAHDADISEIKAHLGLNSKEGEQIQNDPGEEAPPGTAPADARSAKDSAMFADAFQFARAGAEILQPGITLPTFDAKATAISTANKICSLRRQALDRANLTPEGRDMIESVHGKALVLDGLKCGEVRVLFNSVVALAKARNTNKGGRTQDNIDVKQPRRPLTAAEINKRNAEFYGGQNGGKA